MLCGAVRYVMWNNKICYVEQNELVHAALRDAVWMWRNKLFSIE